MKTLLTLAAVLFAAPLFAAEPQYIVVNKAGTRYVVVNRVQAAPCTYCGTSCACPAGNCPAKCPVSATPQPGTLTTASGRLIRQTATGYVYADEGEPAQVLDCSSGKCRWVDSPSRPAYLPAVTPVSYAPASVSSCPNGNCGAARPAAPSVLSPSRRYTFPVK